MIKRPATKADFYRWDAEVRHNDCGGRIYMDSRGDMSAWKCRGCRTPGWSFGRVAKFSPSDLAERFHIQVEAHEEHTLIWLDDPITKKRFVTSVPTYELHKYPGAERFKP